MLSAMYFHQPVNCQLESVILVAGDKLKVRLLAVCQHSIVIKLVVVVVDSNSSGQLPWLRLGSVFIFSIYC